MSSIRRKLLGTLIGTLCLAILAAAFVSYRQAGAEIGEVFDYHLRQIALSLRDRDFSGTGPPSVIGEEEFDFVIRIWNRAGVTVYYSRPHRVLPNLTQLGFSDVDTPEGPWRLFALQYLDETIEVAQPLRVRRRLAADAALRTLVPFFLLLPLVGLLIWLIVTHGLSPLERLARALRARTPQTLDPLEETAVPEEVQPLVHALNDLLVRLDAALGAQRAFVADAAHELRTPLAALQLQAQLVERATTDAGRRAASADLQRGLARARHTVEQLLTLARLEPGSIEPAPLAPLALAEAARTAIGTLIPLATGHDIDLGLARADEGLVVRADASAIQTLLANLIGNALRHTPRGGRIDIVVDNDGGRPLLEVCDSGPGIPAEERERVFDRFYRRGTPAAGEETGSGLGLAIVQRIAQRHGASVQLDEAPGGGLRVRVFFPPAALLSLP